MASSSNPLERLHRLNKERAQLVQMPLWPDDRKAVPNELVRSALFTSSGRNEERRHLTFDRPVLSAAGFQLWYSGEELRQDDLDLWLQVTHLLREHRSVDEAVFTGTSMLTVLGWGNGGLAFDRLEATIRRLQEGRIRLSYDGGRIERGTSMILTTDRRGSKTWNRWEVMLDHKIVELFRPEKMTLVDWELRKKLTPFAKWLHVFYASHACPMDYKVATLRGLCGSRTKALFVFRSRLRQALQSLVDAGFLSAFNISSTTDLVAVHRA